MASLLGQFFSRIEGSQEDIATEGITYILKLSMSARNSLKKYLFNNIGIKFDDINYITQKTGENRERLDISGIDENGIEKIIIEAKFWASLTENQPSEYLKRLKENTVLLFICPNLRKISLKNEIETKLVINNTKYTNDNFIYKMENNKYIIITDWASILEIIKSSLLINHENTLVSDIDQLIGFCEVVDNSSFLPIRDSDLSPSIAKRVNSYCDILDKIVDKLKSDLNANTTGYKATNQKYGYTRYLSIKNFGFALDFNMKMWELNADTPFWVTVKYTVENSHWEQPLKLQNKLKEIAVKLKLSLFANMNNDLCFAIIPLINVIEDKVIENIVNLIELITNELNPEGATSSNKR